MNKEVAILDVTVRDGSYAINYQYTPEQVAAIAGELDRAGIPLIEVSHGCGLGARENAGIAAAASDAEYVVAAKRAAPHARIGVIAGFAPITRREQIDAVIDEVDFIRFAANVGDLEAIEDNISYARSKGVRTFVQMMRSSRLPASRVIADAKIAEGMGAETVYLVDTAGYFVPDDVRAIIAEMKAQLTADVGFHAHNNLGLAVANTIAAIDAGCDAVDASLRGMGRSAGNAQLEAVVSLMKRRGMAGAIDLDVLLDAGERLVVPLMPPRRGIDAADIAMADVNIDLYPLSIFELIAERTGTDLRSFIRQLSRSAGMVEVDIPHIAEAIRHFGGDAEKLFEELGIDPAKR